VVGPIEVNTTIVIEEKDCRIKDNALVPGFDFLFVSDCDF